MLGMTPENAASAAARPPELTPENAALLAEYADHLEHSPLSGHTPAHLPRRGPGLPRLAAGAPRPTATR